MALRDQPYLPLYIQDIMTDEKLNECSAATHGIFIKGIMCLMHKSEEYGKILLKQKDQQTDNKVKNFALKIARHTPYSEEEIEAALFELLAEKVLYIDGDSLCQKRMINDNAISQARSVAGKTSAEVKKTKKSKGKKFIATKEATNNSTTPSTKQSTNPENEIEYESDNEVELKSKKGVPPTVTSEVTQFPVEQNDFTKPDVPGDEIIFPFDTEPMRDLWSSWKKCRWENHRERYGMMGEQADLKRLEGMAFDQIQETILKAISGKWKNLYPEKNGKAVFNSGNKKQQQSSDTGDYLKNYYAQKASNAPPN